MHMNRMIYQMFKSVQWLAESNIHSQFIPFLLNEIPLKMSDVIWNWLSEAARKKASLVHVQKFMSFVLSCL